MSAPAVSEALDYRRYLTVLRRYWMFVVAVLVLSGSLAFAFAEAQTPRYSATSQVVISDRLAESLMGVTSQRADIETELALISSSDLRTEVQRRLGTTVAPSISQVDASRVLAIAVDSTNPELAALAANTYADTYVELRRDQAQAAVSEATSEVADRVESLSESLALTEFALIENPTSVSLMRERDALVEERIRQQLRLDSLEQELVLRSGGAQVASRAEVPTSPFEPNPVSTAVTAALMGLLIAAAVTLLADYLDDSIRTAADVQDAFGDELSVVAQVPHIPLDTKKPGRDRLVAEHRPQSPSAEAYRTLRTTIRFASPGQEHLSILVTSPMSSEGKTMTVANLAIVMAQAGQRVVLVDADLRRPQLANYFGFDRTPGLTELAAGECQPEDAVRRWAPVPNLTVIPAGSIPPNPSEVLGSGRVAQLLRTVGQGADVLIIDSPPVLPVADALILSNLVDQVLVIAMTGRSSRRDLTNAVGALRRVGAPLMGVVLNDASDAGLGHGYGYGYGYGYGEHPKEAEAASRSADDAAPARVGGR